MLKVKTNRDLLNNEEENKKTVVYKSKENDKTFEFVLPNINIQKQEKEQKK